MSRERAKRIGLNRIGYEAYSKQQAEKKMNKEKQNELLINDVESNDSKAISNKQIDEMARVVADAFFEDYNLGCDPHQYTVAERLYTAGYRKQEWISVDERLPDNHTRCLVIAEDGEYYVTYYHSGFYTPYVTHWMPLPEPPMMKGGAECTSLIMKRTAEN